MDLKDYLSTLERGGQATLARELNTSPSHLSQMAAGTSAISPERAVLIEKLSNGKVSRKDLFPSKWGRIWPELAEQEAA